MKRTLCLTTVIIGLLTVASIHCVAQQSNQKQPGGTSQNVSAKVENGGILVFIEGKHFTTYDYSNFGKPVLYPVYGPGQIPMTRNFPMREVKGEAQDHPHHKSMWLGHYLNGHDFWANGRARIKHHSIDTLDSETGAFTVTNRWMTLKDEPVCTEQTTCRFGYDKTSRWMDFKILFKAATGDVTFEDTKEGLFAIRTHPDLRLVPNARQGVEKVFGNARNSEGVTGKAIWGKSARWVNYYGTIDGKDVGIAIFDHPANLRHPTTWHAREYGLVAANPFGLHYFKGLEKGAGAHTIKQGGQLGFQYRAVFYSGKRTVENIDVMFDAFVNSK